LKSRLVDPTHNPFQLNKSMWTKWRKRTNEGRSRQKTIIFIVTQKGHVRKLQN